VIGFVGGCLVVAGSFTSWGARCTYRRSRTARCWTLHTIRTTWDWWQSVSLLL